MLQISWIVDYLPPWLGPLLLGVGLLVLVIPISLFFVSQMIGQPSENPIEQHVSELIVVFGIIVLWVVLYFKYTFIFALVLLLFGRWIEGIAATLFVGKFARLSSGSNGSGSGFRKFVRKKLYYVFGIILTGVISGWLIIYSFALGYIQGPLSVQLTIAWTVFVGSFSLFGLTWKFRQIYIGRPFQEVTDSDTENKGVWLIRILVTGMSLSVVGAQLYNFTLLPVGASLKQFSFSVSLVDIASVLLGNLVYIYAFVLGARIQLNPKKWIGRDLDEF